MMFSVDPLHGGLVMSVCQRHERLLWFRDSYLMLSYHSPPQDDLTIIMSGVANLDLYRLWQTIDSFTHTFKASSVILLLGVGSLVCYRLYKRYRERTTSNTSPKHSPRSPQTITDLLDESIDEDELHNIHAHYFGPEHGCSSADEEWSTTCHSGMIADEEDTSDSASITSSEEWGRGVRKIHRRKNMGNKQSQQGSVCYKQGQVRIMGFPDSPAQTEAQTIGAERPPRSKAALRIPLTHSRENSPATPRRKTRKVLEKYRNVYSTQQQQKFQAHRPPYKVTTSPPYYDRLPPDGLSSTSPADQDLDLADGFKTSYQSQSRLYRDGSIDSTPSDFSLDLSMKDDLGIGTTQKMDRLQNEISEIGRSCANLNDDLGTLKTENCSKDIRTLMKTTYSSYSVASGVDDSVLSSPVAGPTSSTPDRLAAMTPPPFFTESSNQPVGHSLLLNEASQRLYSGITNKVPHLKHGCTPTDSPDSHNNDSHVSLEWDDQGCEMYSEGSTDIIPGCLSGNVVLPDHLRSFEMNMDSPGNSRENASLESDSALNNHSQSSGNGMSSSKHACSSEESGYVEGNTSSSTRGLASPLSPVHERNEPQQHVRRRNKISSNKSNRDSAYSDGGLDIAMARSAENIGDRMDVVAYGEQEWRGSTDRAKTIRQGYRAIPSHVNRTMLRRIRGDNYCGIRSCLFQYLVQGQPEFSEKEALKTLKSMPWILKWNFANRLPYTCDNALDGVKKCLDTLDQIVNTMCSTPLDERECKLATMINCDPDLDVELMEAVKLKMLALAVRLHKEDNACMLAILLFARDTSSSPRSLMENHLNHVGDSSGIDQLELSLLAACLKARVLVVRPSYYGKEDYISYFPPDDFGVTFLSHHPVLVLLAEDDRHYNIIVQ